MAEDKKIDGTSLLGLLIQDGLLPEAKLNELRQITTDENELIKLVTDKGFVSEEDITKKKITPLLLSMHAHSKTSSEQLAAGVEKFIYLLEGSVKVKIEQEEHELGKEDTIYFDASLPHQMINSSGKSAKMFVAISPAHI